MPIIKTINLTPEAEKLREKYFAGTHEFSGFVQQCLDDLHAKRQSKEYLMELRANKAIQIAILEKEVMHIDNQLKEIGVKEHEKSKVKQEVKLERQALEIAINKQIRKLQMWCPEMAIEMLLPLAKDYLAIPEDVRPNSRDYLIGKGILKPKAPAPEAQVQ